MSDRRTTGPNQPFHLLLDILDVLSKLGVPHAIVGAFAASFHGIPRATKDAAAVIWLDDRDERDIKNHLVASGYTVVIRKGDAEDPIQKSLVVTDEHENSADLLIGIRGMDPRARDRRVSSDLMNSKVMIIGAEDLIAMKIFAGGPQDILDVQGILQVSGEKLDLDLLRKLAQRYGPGVSRKLDGYLKEFLRG